MITYRATLDVPAELLRFVTRRQLTQIVRAALVLTQFEHKYAD